MNVNYWTALASLTLLALISPDAAGQPGAEPAGSWSWPQHHGPQRTNISPETGLLKEWPEGGPPLLWKATQCGAGYSGVSIAEGLIFTAGNFGKTELVLAFDLDGQLRWKEPSGPAWEQRQPRFASHSHVQRRHRLHGQSRGASDCFRSEHGPRALDRRPGRAIRCTVGRVGPGRESDGR